MLMLRERALVLGDAYRFMRFEMRSERKKMMTVDAYGTNGDHVVQIKIQQPRYSKAVTVVTDQRPTARLIYWGSHIILGRCVSFHAKLVFPREREYKDVM